MSLGNERIARLSAGTRGSFPRIEDNLKTESVQFLTFFPRLLPDVNQWILRVLPGYSGPSRVLCWRFIHLWYCALVAHTTPLVSLLPVFLVFFFFNIVIYRFGSSLALSLILINFLTISNGSFCFFSLLYRTPQLHSQVLPFSSSFLSSTSLSDLFCVTSISRLLLTICWF